MDDGPLDRLCYVNLADCSRQRQARLHTIGFGLARAGGPIASLRAEWLKASLFCGTQVTRVRIDDGVGYSSSRTTRSCRHKALLSSSEPDSIKAAHCRIRFGEAHTYIEARIM